MILPWIGWAAVLLLAGPLLALLARRSERALLAFGSASTVAACAIGAAASVAALLSGRRESIRIPWPLPLGEIHIAIDPLASFFLLCIFLVSGLAALYGWGYLKAYTGHRPIGPAVALFNVLVAAMALLVVARDGILFLAAWEIMSIASFFLVTFEDEQEVVRRAGMTYLIASHLGAACLIVLFVILAGGTGSFDFDRFAAAGAPAGIAGACFLLAVAGFGTKAGFWPVHVWLPDAHPAAPSHVSAVMSGVMIKMGIYGLLRTLTFLGPMEPWWGSLLVVLGAITGIVGVLHALAQHQLKRLLAYSSVENIGIIAIGIGLGILGQSRGQPAVAFLGYAGALLHALNHGLFKGLLFQAAGSVIQATGARDLDALGGLARRMPVTGSAFLAGSAAIVGVPPFNGFASELLIYIAAFLGASRLTGPWAVSAIAAVPAMALIGGLAAAAFAKAYGVVFLGSPRSEATARGREAGFAMTLPMALGAAGCLALGVWPQGAWRLLAPVVASYSGASPPAESLAALSAITRLAIVLAAVAATLATIRLLLLRGRDVRTAPTWGCAYAAPTPRMQYTGASFAQPLLAPFGPLLDIQVKRHGPEGYFPREATLDERTGDPAGERLLRPATRHLLGILGRLRIIQQGRVQLYLAYVLVTLIVLLVWQLGGGSGR
ncbi:MAG: proton-conducting transporter membrane subunit [Candidatus Eiseniibacteriota bacterium]